MVRKPLIILITVLEFIVAGSSELKAQQDGALRLGGLVFGYFEGNNVRILFDMDQSFLYKDGKVNGRGVFEKNRCATTNNKTGEVLSQGNTLLTFDGFECCYQIRLIGRNLKMSKVWKKGGGNRNFTLPGEQPLRNCSTRVLVDKTRWADDPSYKPNSPECIKLPRNAKEVPNNCLKEFIINKKQFFTGE